MINQYPTNHYHSQQPKIKKTEFISSLNKQQDPTNPKPRLYNKLSLRQYLREPKLIIFFDIPIIIVIVNIGPPDSLLVFRPEIVAVIVFLIKSKASRRSGLRIRARPRKTTACDVVESVWRKRRCNEGRWSSTELKKTLSLGCSHYLDSFSTSFLRITRTVPPARQVAFIL